MSDKKEIRISINFTKNDISILEELKDLTKLNRSDVIRQAIYQYYKKIKG